MRKSVVVAALAFAALSGIASARADDAPPPWAWGFTTPPAPGTPPAVPAPAAALDNSTLLSLPGSKLSFTRAQIANPFGPADWFPDDHPTMPDVVAHGRALIGFKKGKTYDWPLTHLADAFNEVTPRSFFGLMIAAAKYGGSPTRR